MTGPKSERLAGGVAVITGGASGIGLAFARAYAEKGAHVVIVDIDESAMEQARAHLLPPGPLSTASAWTCRTPASIAELGDFASGLGSLSRGVFERRRHLDRVHGVGHRG